MSLAFASEGSNNIMAGATGGSLMSLLPMVLIFVIFYFFLIRPQVKKQKKVEEMINNLKKGDNVIAAGGIYGTVVKVEQKMVFLEIGDNLRIKVQKNSVTELVDVSNNKAENGAAS